MVGRHCEERSDEAIQEQTPLYEALALDCFASLAMTAARIIAP
jgi:hypothetical protein